MNDPDLHFDSKCIHGGQAECAVTGAVMLAIYTSSTYAQESPGVHRGFEYSRSHNPTRYAFERALASLEGTGLDESVDASHGGFAFSSGLAAAGTCLELLDAGGRPLRRHQPALLAGPRAEPGPPGPLRRHDRSHQRRGRPPGEGRRPGHGLG